MKRMIQKVLIVINAIKSIIGKTICQGTNKESIIFSPLTLMPRFKYFKHNFVNTLICHDLRANPFPPYGNLNGQPCIYFPPGMESQYCKAQSLGVCTVHSYVSDMNCDC